MENKYLVAHDTVIYDVYEEPVGRIQWLKLTADVAYPFWKVEYAQRKSGGQGVIDYLYEAHLRSIGFENSKIAIHLGVAIQVGSLPVPSTITFADVTLQRSSDEI